MDSPFKIYIGSWINLWKKSWIIESDWDIIKKSRKTQNGAISEQAGRINVHKSANGRTGQEVGGGARPTVEEMKTSASWRESSNTRETEYTFPRVL